MNNNDRFMVLSLVSVGTSTEPPLAKHNYQGGGEKCGSAEETQGVLRGAGAGKKVGCTYILK